ncbi:NAC domain-containing protein, partial [Cephalotus follicularis]
NNSKPYRSDGQEWRSTTKTLSNAHENLGPNITNEGLFPPSDLDPTNIHTLYSHQHKLYIQRRGKGIILVYAPPGSSSSLSLSLSLSLSYLLLTSKNPKSRMNREKLIKMAGAVRTGGKGSVRRKKKAVHKTTTTDDKRLQSTLKRIGVNAIPAIEEVNIFKDDVVIQFINPKVQASIAANTWVVSGSPQTKKLQDILPGIINQLGPDNLDNLRKLAEQFQKQAPGAGAAAAAIPEEDDDDDVPDLVAGETFEAAAEEGQVVTS